MKEINGLMEMVSRTHKCMMEMVCGTHLEGKKMHDGKILISCALVVSDIFTARDHSY